MPYNPQQNGVAKRMNRTILNKVCSMIFFKNVKLMFWVDVVLCVVYVKNRCPSNAIRNKTPYEMWYGHIPSVKHLRVFNFKHYEHLLKLNFKHYDLDDATLFVKKVGKTAIYLVVYVDDI